MSKHQNKQKGRRRPEKDGSLKEQIERLAQEQLQGGDGAWMRFDNAALIFPASENAEMLNMYRLSVLLKEPVRPLVLQQALNDTVPRFPTMTAAVKRGVFWFYLEPGDAPLVLTEQTDYPCRKIPLDARHAMIRVTYFSCEISLEVFHVATDANGGFVFLNTLVARYLELLGYTITDRTGILDVRDRPRPEEMADSYQQFADRVTPRWEKDRLAYKMGGQRLQNNALVLVKGVMPSAELHAAARRLGVTVGQLGAAVLIWAIEEDRKQRGRRRNRDIAVLLPVNLRKLAPDQKTLRNFMSMLSLYSDAAGSFEQLVEEVRTQFVQKYTPEYFRGLVNYNVKIQHNPLAAVLPLPIKMVALRRALRMLSDRVTTTLFSNLGVVPAPKDFEAFVSRMEFSFGVQSYAGTVLSAATFGDTAVLTFSRSVRETGVETLFFRKLSELGVPLAVECTDPYAR